MPSTPRVFVGSATVRVVGATCGHCLDAVSAAVHRVPGVRSVAVDPTARTVTVVVDAPTDRADIDAAVRLTGHGSVPVR